LNFVITEKITPDMNEFLTETFSSKLKSCNEYVLDCFQYTMSKDDYKTAELSTVSILMVLLTTSIAIFIISGTL
jgi:hypothetical protein